jgi:hypothetical protein
MISFSNKMRLIALTVILGLAACAPEPTDPSTTSLAGVWTSNAHVFALSNIRMKVVQEPEGIVSGEWTAKRDNGSGSCTQIPACDVTGDLIGRNTVSQVQIEVLGAGRFEGSVVEPNTMRGVFVVQDSYDTITFVRTAASFNTNRLPSR